MTDVDTYARELAEVAKRASEQRANETELGDDLDPVIRQARGIYSVSTTFE